MFQNRGYTKVNDKLYRKEIVTQPQQIILNGRPMQGPVEKHTLDIEILDDAIIDENIHKKGIRIIIDGNVQIDDYADTFEELIMQNNL